MMFSLHVSNNSVSSSFRFGKREAAALFALFGKIILVVVLGFANPVGAQEAGGILALDCWIFEDEDKFKTNHIRCIRDRSHLPSLEDTEAPVNVVAHDQLHRLLHQGNSKQLDRFVKENIRMLNADDMWTIRIFTYPAPWSWREEMPQKLVKAALCPKGEQCSVFIRRD